MIKKFTDNDYLIAKSSDYLLFECECCGCEFKKQKKFLKSFLKRKSDDPRARIGSIRFCSKRCEYEKRKASFVEKDCAFCGSVIFTKNHLLRKSKSGNMFCSKSCSAKYNNTHKTTGNKRSKMEIWIETELRNKYDFEIIFNGKEAINSELDIYIPILNLAFELNGIFHYEPIYGEDKLNSIKTNDDRKFQACLEKKIELCIIDVSGSIKFKPERDRKYLNIICEIIDKKILKAFNLEIVSL